MLQWLYQEVMDMRRSDRRKARLKKQWFILALLSTVFIFASLILFFQKEIDAHKQNRTTITPNKVKSSKIHSKARTQTARIMANGDLLYHDGLYMSALKADGTYDFSENFQYAKEWLHQAELVIGDFEGTINPDFPLAGYPLFNAPESVVSAIKDAGYQVVDLAHNHILDSQLSGIFSTAQIFESKGITPVGVYTHEQRSQAPLTIKEVNGIKIAILAYSYGFNGMEANLSQEEYDRHLSTLDEEKMQAEIDRAEKEADITVVMPQMGVEYQLQPTEEQGALYHKMVEWGADIIFGGHPHVVQPSEILEKNGQKKLIIYSMGNFISNQRIETMDGVENAQWTERGVLMDVTIEKNKNGTQLKTAHAHPTWVSRREKGSYSPEGYPLYTYQTLILEDFIEGGKYRQQLDDATKERVDSAYQEMKEHIGLHWP